MTHKTPLTKVNWTHEIIEEKEGTNELNIDNANYIIFS